MSEPEFEWWKNRRRFVERLFMQERRQTQERYVVKSDEGRAQVGPAHRITARQRCRAVRQAVRTRLAQRLLRLLGLPVALISGMVS